MLVNISSTIQKQPLEVFCKKGVLRNFVKFTVKHLCKILFKKETLAQVFSCEFYEISKNAFFYRTPPVATFEICKVTDRL